MSCALAALQLFLMNPKQRIGVSLRQPMPALLTFPGAGVSWSFLERLSAILHASFLSDHGAFPSVSSNWVEAQPHETG